MTSVNLSLSSFWRAHLQDSYALQAEAQRLASEAASLEAEALKRRPLLDLLDDAPGNLARLQVLCYFEQYHYLILTIPLLSRPLIGADRTVPREAGGAAHTVRTGAHTSRGGTRAARKRRTGTRIPDCFAFSIYLCKVRHWMYSLNKKLHHCYK